MNCLTIRELLVFFQSGCTIRIIDDMAKLNICVLTVHLNDVNIWLKEHR